MSILDPRISKNYWDMKRRERLTKDDKPLYIVRHKKIKSDWSCSYFKYNWMNNLYDWFRIKFTRLKLTGSNLEQLKICNQKKHLK